MKAAVYYRYGGPEVVKVQEIPLPVPAENEVLIQVKCSGVNRTDTGFRSAEYFISRFWSGLFKPKYPVLGCQYAGVVTACGANVKEFKPGDRVFGFDDAHFGANAEYVCKPEKGAIAHIPAEIDFETAAMLTEGANYALCNIRAAKVQAGQRILVNGGTGAIGSAAIQLLKHFGAYVVAVCATAHLDKVKLLGADEVIDYTQEDFTQSDQSFDFVFDAVGKSTFGKCRRILKAKGVYISTELGPGIQNPWLALFTPLAGGKRLLFPIPTFPKEDLNFLASLALEGKFKPLLDRTYQLQEIAEAHHYVQQGFKIGNVLITMN